MVDPLLFSEVEIVHGMIEDGNIVVNSVADS